MYPVFAETFYELAKNLVAEVYCVSSLIWFAGSLSSRSLVSLKSNGIGRIDVYRSDVWYAV